MEKRHVTNQEPTQLRWLTVSKGLASQFQSFFASQNRKAESLLFVTRTAKTKGIRLIFEKIQVARGKEALEKLKRDNEGKVEILVGDLGSDTSLGQQAVDLAKSSFGRLDGLIINHGSLKGTARLAEANVEEWKAGFDINVFSSVAIVHD